MDRLAAPAGQLRPDVPDHLEVPRHVLQHLAAVLARHRLAEARGLN
jgi:hypothetical protein